jgi:hypothetical protein
MLFLLNKKKKLKGLIYVGDKLNLIYRFKGVFFVMLGNCIFNRQKSIAIYLKKKNYSFIFTILFINIQKIYKIDTFYFNNKKWKSIKNK